MKTPPPRAAILKHYEHMRCARVCILVRVRECAWHAIHRKRAVGPLYMPHLEASRQPLRDIQCGFTSLAQSMFLWMRLISPVRDCLSIAMARLRLGRA